MSFSLALPVTTSATVFASGPVAFGTLATIAGGALVAGAAPCGEAGLAPGSTICPKTMVSNFFFSVLLSKSCIVIGLPIVTCAPFFTVVVGTAAQTSPCCAVFSRR